jgi:hypothetical protein
MGRDIPGLAPPTGPVAMPVSRSGMAAVMSARPPLRHLDFGRRDCRQARQSIAEYFELIWSGGKCPPAFRGPPAVSETAGSDRAVGRWVVDLGGVAERERFRPVRPDDPSQVVPADLHAWACEHRRRSKRWKSQRRPSWSPRSDRSAVRNTDRLPQSYTGRDCSGSFRAGGVGGDIRTATRAAFPAGVICRPGSGCFVQG